MHYVFYLQLAGSLTELPTSALHRHAVYMHVKHMQHKMYIFGLGQGKDDIKREKK